MQLVERLRSRGRFYVDCAQAQVARTARRATGRPLAAGDGAMGYGLDTFFHRDGRLVARGWAFHPLHRVAAVGFKDGDGPFRPAHGFGYASPDVDAQAGPDAGACRFQVVVRCPDAATAVGWTLCALLADGTCVELKDAIRRAQASDPYDQLWERFLGMLRDRPGGGDLLEIGARARSGFSYRPWIPEAWRYVGLDIVEGPNVDIVGDAHRLSDSVEPASFDAFFTVATFEHLAMPWKVALELNRVLRPGGFGIIVTHQCWPVHEAPWDFWRFSDSAWQALFNRATGFEVVEAAMGNPAAVTPRIMNDVTAGMGGFDSYLGSSVLVRKISDTDLRWDVDLAAVVEGLYPG
jgi:Methyltransferase domain